MKLAIQESFEYKFTPNHGSFAYRLHIIETGGGMVLQTGCEQHKRPNIQDIRVFADAAH